MRVQGFGCRVYRVALRARLDQRFLHLREREQSIKRERKSEREREIERERERERANVCVRESPPRPALLPPAQSTHLQGPVGALSHTAKYKEIS